MKKLSRKKIEEMAKEIKKFLVENDLASDVYIFYNDKREEAETGIIKEDCYPWEYFEYYNDDHILSMSFEGPLYEILNYYVNVPTLSEKFNAIFKKYGVYYELGNAWNLSVY